MKLNFLNKTGVKIDKKPFFELLKNGVLERNAGILQIPIDGEIGLNLISDKEIRELNRIYRGKDKTTDVLSFSYQEEAKMPNDSCIGEIFISVETAKRQARDGLMQELKVLFTHGLLHIFGFTHENDKDEQEMEEAALKILRNL